MSRLKLYQKVAVVLFLIIELVGFWGILSPEWHERFVSMTPVNLVFMLLVLLLLQETYHRAEVLWMALVFLVGYFIEVLGVSTGVIFGEYSYGEGLGFKLLDVPPTMGINWLLLCYTTVRLVKELRTNKVVKALTASLIMVGLDFVMEPVAIAFDFWSWEGGLIPFQNYVAWLVIAFGLNLIWFSLKTNSVNNFSMWLFTYLIVFFTTMNVVFA